MIKLCTGSVLDTMGRKQLVIDGTGSVEGNYAFIYCGVEIWTGVTDGLLTDSLTHRL